jgi:hypothetical protein
VTSVAAVSTLSFTLYANLPMYPPPLGLSLAIAAILFLITLVLLHLGLAAIRSRLSLPMRFLLPIGGLFVLGRPLTYFLGERIGGLTVLVGFGVGWLAIAVLLLAETVRAPSPRRTDPDADRI